MSENKKYYWLKLKDDFFMQKEIKKLRTIAGGDTFTIIYLKLQLLSLKNEGKIVFEGFEDTFEQEMALTIDEDIENVKLTMLFLYKHGLLEKCENDEYLLPEATQCMGKITQEGIRKKSYRERLGQCPDVVPALSENVPPDIERRYREKRKEIDRPQPQRFMKPSLEDVKSYLKERNVTSFKADQFYDYYESKGWLVGKTPMKDWRAAVRTWERNDINKGVAKPEAKINTYVPEYVPPEDRAPAEAVAALRKKLRIV